MTFVQIAAEQISQEALDGLIDEFVTREGTNYGIEEERTLEGKRQAVLSQIERGEVVIVFDTDSATSNIILKEQLPQR